MQSFTFNIDQKISMWTRSTKHIEAETYQEAEKILKSQHKNGEIFESLDEYEFLYDTQKEMDIIEISNHEGNLINFSDTSNEQEIFLLGLS